MASVRERERKRKGERERERERERESTSGCLQYVSCRLLILVIIRVFLTSKPTTTIVVHVWALNKVNCISLKLKVIIYVLAICCM